MRARTAAALAAGFAAGLVLGWRARERDLIAPGARREDLDYLLAHFWGEVDGHPDRSHWQLPMLREAAGRLQVAAWLGELPARRPRSR